MTRELQQETRNCDIILIRNHQTEEHSKRIKKQKQNNRKRGII